MKNKNEALVLIQNAFHRAQEKLGPDSTQMTLPVLKNRLLQMTGRKFNPADYGLSDLRSLIGQFPTRLKLLETASHAIVELLPVPFADNATSAPAKAVRAIPIKNATKTAGGKDVIDETSPSKPLSPSSPPLQSSGRIREDLWLAMVDFASGKSFVWDESLGLAREAVAEDMRPRLPTLTRADLIQWRAAFFDTYKATLNSAELEDANRWLEREASTNHLPKVLQSRWNVELSRLVRQRLQAFFSTSRSAPLATQALTETTLAPPAEKKLSLDEQLSAARDKGDNFVVGELLCQSITVGSNFSEEAFARAVSAWSSHKGLAHSPESTGEVIEKIDDYSSVNLASAFINVLRRLKAAKLQIPEEARDLAFRLKSDIMSAYGIEEKKAPLDICKSAIAQLDSTISEIEGAVARFIRTTPATAKPVSIEILKIVELH